MWRRTCDASHSFLQPAGLDLGKSLVEAQEAVQRHLGLVVIIHLRTHSEQAIIVVLYCIVLYYIILYYVILYYIILYYIILCYIIYI